MVNTANYKSSAKDNTGNVGFTHYWCACIFFIHNGCMCMYAYTYEYI